MAAHPYSDSIELSQDYSEQEELIATPNLAIASNAPNLTSLSAVELTSEKDRQMDQATENTQARLGEQFPHGFTRILTDGTDLLCGLFAIRESIQKQYPEIAAPDIQDLKLIANMPNLKIRSRDTYTDSELARIFQQWATSHGHEDLVLAYIVEEACPYVSGYGSADDTTARVLWIHNDNAQVLYAGSEIAVVNHWSGVQPNPAPASLTSPTNVALAAASEPSPMASFHTDTGTGGKQKNQSQVEDALSEPLPEYQPRAQSKQPQQAQDPSDSSVPINEPRRSKRNVKSTAKAEHQQQQPQKKPARAPPPFRLLCPMTDCNGSADTLVELNRHRIECHKAVTRFESAKVTKVEFLRWLNGDTKASVPPETRALYQHLLANTPSNSIPADANTTSPALKRKATKPPARKSSKKPAVGQGRLPDQPATEQKDTELQSPTPLANSAAGTALPATSSTEVKRKPEDGGSNTADSTTAKKPKTHGNIANKLPRIILKVTENSRQVENEREQSRAAASRGIPPRKAYQTRSRSRSQSREVLKKTPKNITTRSQSTSHELPTIEEEPKDPHATRSAPSLVDPTSLDGIDELVLTDALAENLKRSGDEVVFAHNDTRSAATDSPDRISSKIEDSNQDDASPGSDTVPDEARGKAVRFKNPEPDTSDSEDAGDEGNGSARQLDKTAVSAGSPIRRSRRGKGESVSMYSHMQVLEKKKLEAVEKPAQEGKAVPRSRNQQDYTRWGKARLELVGNGNNRDVLDASILDQTLSNQLHNNKKGLRKKKQQSEDEKKKCVSTRVKEICYSDGNLAPTYNDGKNTPKNANRNAKMAQPKVIWSDYPDVQPEYEKLQNGPSTSAQLAAHTSESSTRDKHPGGVPPPSADDLSDAHPDPIPSHWEGFERTDRELQGALWAVIAKPFLTEAIRAVDAGCIKVTKKQPPNAKKSARKHKDREPEEDTQENSQEEPQAALKMDTTEKRVNTLLLAAITYIANLQRTHGVLTQEHDRILREKEDEIAVLIDRHPDGKALRLKDAQIGRMKERRRQYKMTKRLERKVLDEEHTELRNERSELEHEKQKIEEEQKKLEEEKRELKEQRRGIEEDSVSSGS